jgi:arabinogalactan endo-1,4-beta-galactosidase
MRKKSSFHGAIPAIISGLLIMVQWSCPQSVHAQFVKGADIGWLSQMESTGYKFHDSTGAEANCLQILKDHGINTVRLRVWVNPSDDRINGHCSKPEVVAMAVRAKNMGFRVMIDFHYSDSWADPGKQTKPAAWASHSFSQLLNDLYSHTFDVLSTLKAAGVVADWVQIGNEIPGGILWPDGSTANWNQLAQLLNQGYDAAKSVDSSIQLILHIDQGNNNARFRYFFDAAAAHGVRYDVIGMSYYPYWLGTDYTATINALGANMNDMVSRYGKEVMVVETGGDYTKVQNTYDMLVAVIDKVKAVPDNKGLGVIYWEPEGEKSWSGYQLNCWGPDGKPTHALDAFLTNTMGVNDRPGGMQFRIYPNPNFDGLVNLDLPDMTRNGTLRIYTSDGQLVRQQSVGHSSHCSLDVHLAPGIYLVSLESGQQKAFRELMIGQD